MGKSTLLKAIGWGLVVGFPRHVRCLYVDQLEVNASFSNEKWLCMGLVQESVAAGEASAHHPARLQHLQAAHPAVLS